MLTQLGLTDGGVLIPVSEKDKGRDDVQLWFTLNEVRPLAIQVRKHRLAIVEDDAINDSWLLYEVMDLP